MVIFPRLIRFIPSFKPNVKNVKISRLVAIKMNPWYNKA